MARKKKKPFYEKVLIEDIGAEGKALARIGDLVVFTKMAIPGDIVDLQVIRKRKRHQEAVITRIHEYSRDRTEAICSHFGACGGCKWQHLPYEKQLYYKQKQVADQLTRIGKAEIPEISPILGSPGDTFYRNKLEFSFSNKQWLSREEIASGKDFSSSPALGFHAPGVFDKVIHIEKCWLQPDPSNAIRNFIYRHAVDHGLEFFDIREKRGFLRTLTIRTSSPGETMVILSFFREDKTRRERLLEALRDAFPEITSLLYVINPKGNDTITDLPVIRYSGRDHIFEEMEGLRFKIGPKSFYQTNSEQAFRLYQVVREFAGFSGNETVYDLYTGTGTIANFVARSARKVIGIESVPEAISDAKTNAALNQVNNTKFFAGDIREVLNENFLKSQGAPEVVITDPPRAGMHKDVVAKLAEMDPQKIVYVSCNPATQARDIALLDQQYQITKIQPVDMFPHTHHVENVVLLEKK